VTPEIRTGADTRTVGAADQQRLDAVIDRVRSLPLSADGAIEEIIDACDSVQTTMGEIAERVGREPALAAIIMRQANSAYYGFGRKVDTLGDACVLLGIGTIRTLALTNAALRFLAVDRDGLTQMRRSLLEHSIATALASRALARRAGAHPEKAFLCGLIHELGTIVLTRVSKPEFLHVYVTARKDHRGFAEVEMEILGFDHAELGSRIAELWRFPAPICDAIACQHDPSKARVERILAEALHCGDWLAAELGKGLVPFDHPAWPDQRAADHFGMSPLGMEELTAEVRDGAASWSLAA
jgi:HD-like signal output (HDOD) protein